MKHYDRYPYFHLSGTRPLEVLKNKTLLSRLVPLPSGTSRILDVGCGAAAVMERFARRYWRKKITAVDNSALSLQAARKLAPADYRLADAGRLPFSDQSFDLVLACGVIHHLRRPAEALKEINRVVDPGGLIYLTLYNYYHPYRWAYFLFTPLRRFYPRFWLEVFSRPYFPVYALVKYLVVGGGAGFKESRADLADRLFVPLARFEKPEVWERRFKINHWQVLGRGRHALGTMSSYLLKKC